MGVVQLGQRLVDVERAAECLLRRDRAVAQPGEPAQHQIDLDLRALDEWRGRFAEQFGQHHRCDARQHRPRAEPVFVVAVAV